MADPKKPDKNDIAKVLFPAETIQVDIGRGITVDAEIFPLAFSHLQKFARDIINVVTRVLAAAPQIKALSKDDQRKVLIGTALPHVLSDMLPCVAECVVFKGEASGLSMNDPRFPAKVAGPIVNKWIAIMFEDMDEWRPWTDAIERAVAAFGDESQTSETASSSSSRPDSA